jgi:phosphoglycolate phosphatase-like HAD superfamily hydrolase
VPGMMAGMREPADPMVAVVDVDGVLADVRHRLRHVTERPKDWRAFFAAAADDPLLPEGEETVRTLAEVYDIVYLSGRPERLREVTEQWFGRHDLPEGPLLLRPYDDYRPGRFFKVEALRRIAETRTVVVLVDDDPRVLEEARSAGFDVLPATWMGEHSALREAQERDGRT